MSTARYSAFPVQAYLGSTVGSSAPRIIEEYDDGTYRVYRKPGAVPLRYMTIHLESLSTTEMQSVLDFFEQVTQPGNPTGGQFLMTDFRVAADVVDESQQLATAGALLAVFLDTRIDFQEDENCVWSLVSDINVKLIS